MVLSDDTDVFVLLVYFFWKWQPDTNIKMERIIDDKIFDINASATRLSEKVNSYWLFMPCVAVTQCLTHMGKAKQQLCLY